MDESDGKFHWAMGNGLWELINDLKQIRIMIFHGSKSEGMNLRILVVGFDIRWYAFLYDSTGEGRRTTTSSNLAECTVKIIFDRQKWEDEKSNTSRKQ